MRHSYESMDFALIDGHGEHAACITPEVSTRKSPMGSNPANRDRAGRGTAVRAELSRFSRSALAMGAVAVLSASVLAACTSSNSNSNGNVGNNANANAGTSGSTGPITIGTSLSLTGDFSADGQAFKIGYQLWAKDVNAKGGLLGRHVNLTIMNDASSPNQVMTNYQTLFGTDHVDLAFGPFSSLLTGPASSVAARYGMAFVEGAGGSPSVFDTPSNQADHNVFDVSLPVADELVPLVRYIASLPPNRRPKTAAYPMVQDPFADPPVQLAQTMLSRLGVTTVPLPSQIFPDAAQAYAPAAQAVAARNPDLVVLGSASVPPVEGFMKAFAKLHYVPRMFIATAGPDQGAAFTSAVGIGNADGMMVPNGWYGGYANPSSRQMVQEYIAQYHGTPSGVNADVAEAYSVGQVIAQAVIATGGTDNAKIISYLHSGVTLSSVQGPVKFDSLGENGSAVSFVFQWQKSNFNQVLPARATGSVSIIATKPAWTS